MEFIKEKLSWTEKIADKTFIINADTDVIVPDTKPDIKRILQVDAFAKITSSEIQSDRILIGGNITFNVIYSADDELSTLQCIKTTAPFTDVVPLKGTSPKMVGDFDVDVSGVSFKVLNGRKFSLKGSVEISALIGNDVNESYVNDIVDTNIQSRSENISFFSRVASCEKNFIINDNIVVPQMENSISEVVKVSPMVNEYSIKVISNKVIIKGELVLNCAYTDASEYNIKTMSNVVPFTEILDVDGIQVEDLCNTKIIVVDNTYNCQEDASGEVRSIEIATEVKVKLFALREKTISAINDCYATYANLNTETAIVKLPKKICDINYEETLKTQIAVSDSDPIPGRVYDVFSKAYIENTEMDDNNLKVSGVVDNYVLYITEEKDMPIFCVKNEVEFTKSFDCGDSTSPDGMFNVKVLNTSYAINDIKSFDLRINIKIDGVMWENIDTNIITDVSVGTSPVENDVASLTVYFVQANDTLWDIAKKYRTTVESIKLINSIEDNEIQNGMQLLIPKFKI